MVAVTIVALLLTAGYSLAGDHFYYGLDDPYIHLSIARNILSGVWGLNANQAAGASSSPLWTVLMAGASALSPNLALYAPLAINLLLLVSALHLLQQALVVFAPAYSSVKRFWWLLFFCLAMPAAPLIAGGMEHMLQINVAILMLAVAIRLLQGDSAVLLLRCSPLIAVLGLVRPEFSFMISGLALLLLLRKRWTGAIVICAIAVVGPLLYAALASLQGLPLIPAPLLLKTEAEIPGRPIFSFIFRVVASVILAPHITLPAVLQVVLLRRPLPGVATDPRVRDLRFLYLLLFVQHICFARLHWFFRYEAYLALFGAFLCALDLLFWLYGNNQGLPRRRVAAALLSLSFLALAVRGVYALYCTPLAIRDIALQQGVFTRFAARYYAGRTVVANDVGLLAYSGRVRILDSYGLANTEIAESKRRGQYNSAQLESQARREQAAFAVIYPEWLKSYGGTPASWSPVFRWRVPGHVVLGVDQVTVYAIGVAPETLRGQWQEFAATLPSAIEILPLQETRP
ncbi:MAG: hypothetical protein K1X75_00605 [Leptospirales bacterium]|nr:hypothetical protein [Leptospirales bacterium]